MTQYAWSIDESTWHGPEDSIAIRRELDELTKDRWEEVER